jgi:hypothetical protein
MIQIFVIFALWEGVKTPSEGMKKRLSALATQAFENRNCALSQSAR